jgi:adenylate kinase family enzyme
MIIVPLGYKGSGKTTVARAVEQFCGFTLISMRRLLIEANVLASLSAGGFRYLPDDTILSLVTAAFASVRDTQDIIVDGAPRTVGQFTAIEAVLMPRKISILHLARNRAQSIRYALSRIECSNCTMPYSRDVGIQFFRKCDFCGSEDAPNERIESRSMLMANAEEFESWTAPILGVAENRKLKIITDHSWSRSLPELKPRTLEIYSAFSS